MKKLALLGILICLPARSAVLTGGIQSKQIDWKVWHRNFDYTVTRRLQEKIIRGRWEVRGEVRIAFKVTQEGNLSLKVLEDKSVNMSLLAPNVLFDMKNSSQIKFPPGTSRSEVIKEIIITEDAIIDEDTNREDIEVVK